MKQKPVAGGAELVRMRGAGAPAPAPDRGAPYKPNALDCPIFLLIIDMWVLVLLLPMSAVVLGEKLDHVYLPPGAVTAGGGPGDLSPPPTTPIPIISYVNKPNEGDGSYAFSYETGNGIRAQEEGVLKQDVPEGPGEAVVGIYSYTGPDGIVYSVAYTADENGFVARGDYLPTPPPVPPEIQAALDKNAAEEAAAAATATPAPAPAPAAPAQIGYTKSFPSYTNYNQKYKSYFQRY